jgi:hypothetical protein
MQSLICTTTTTTIILILIIISDVTENAANMVLIRILLLTATTRTVWHYWFNTWPDHGVPMKDDKPYAGNILGSLASCF